MKLRGNTILITGGAAGIGFSLAKHFAELGNQVMIAGRSETKLQEAKQMIPGLITFVCDLRIDEQINQLVSELREGYPDLNVIINNAGVQYQYDLIQSEPDLSRIDEELEVNLNAPIKLCALLSPLLMRQKESAIVNVTSALALVPKSSAPVYCATKAALSSFTKTLREQVKDTSIHVFEVIPSLVDTGMTKENKGGKIQPDELTNEFLRCFAHNQYEIRIGKVKLLYALNRLAPSLTRKIMRNR